MLFFNPCLNPLHQNNNPIIINILHFGKVKDSFQITDSLINGE